MMICNILFFKQLIIRIAGVWVRGGQAGALPAPRRDQLGQGGEYVD